MSSHFRDLHTLVSSQHNTAVVANCSNLKWSMLSAYCACFWFSVCRAVVASAYTWLARAVRDVCIQMTSVVVVNRTCETNDAACRAHSSMALCVWFRASYAYPYSFACKLIHTTQTWYQHRSQTYQQWIHAYAQCMYTRACNTTPKLSTTHPGFHSILSLWLNN